MAISRDYHHRVRPGIGERADSLARLGDETRQVIEQLLDREGWLNTENCLRVLEKLAISIPRWAITKSSEEAARLTDKWGCPVALKALSEDVLHKSDVGAVLLDLTGQEVVRTAYDALVERLSAAHPEIVDNGLLLQEQAPDGLEVIDGARRDPHFGPFVLLGLGGVITEILRDFAIRIAPLDKETALQMITSLRSSPLLTGYRSRPACDLDALAEVILAISDLIVAFPQIDELEVNPVRVYPTGLGARGLDVRIRLSNSKRQEVAGVLSE